MRLRFINFGILILIFISSYQTVHPQYFGRNKVQYENFDFKVLRTSNFDIYYYQSEKEAAYDAAIILERWNARISKVFNHKLQKFQPIILYANHPDFQQTNVIEGLIPQGTGGVTEGLRNRIILPFTGLYSENSHVLGHELVHAFQYEIIKASPGGLRSAGVLPLWMIEGMAEYLSIGRTAPLTSMWMRDAVLNNEFPTIEKVSRDPKYFPYRWGHAIWAFIAGNWGDKAVVQIFRNALSNSNLDSAFISVTGKKVEDVSKEWENNFKDFYGNQIQGKKDPKDVGERVIKGDEVNLAPSISPNGKYISFLSTRELFSLDLYLADASSGEIIRKLVSSNTDEHFDALRFMNSAGAWSPDSKSLAIVVDKDGDNQIAIIDVNSGSLKARIKLKEADEILNIAWSPDGKKLLVSGSYGGITDLYLYNLQNKSSEKLTNDKYAEIQPSWSSDGKRIVFVTDRNSTTNLNKFEFGKLKVAVYNLETKEFNIISTDEKATHLNPHFSPDDKNIFFLSNPDGFSNLYRFSLTESQLYKVTDIATGISGLTETSPAFSLSIETGKAAFSVFYKSGYEIHTLEKEGLNGVPFEGKENFIANVSLPPQEKNKSDIVENYLSNLGFGLDTQIDPEMRDYNPSLGMVYIGQTGIGVSIDEFGSNVGGGINMLFSDLLGNHIISSTLQANGSFKDIGGEAMYINRKGRLAWGVGIGHIPYLTGSINGRLDTVNIDGNLYLADNIELTKQRVFSDNFQLLAQYPLTTNRRIEFTAGYNRVGFDYDLERIILVGDQVVGQSTEDIDAPSALHLVTGSAAYVGDYSFFGFTSPISGRRFRLELTPTFGSLQFLSALLDYRNYFFFNPLTFAVRFLHYGRYLEDAENGRLSPLTIGFNSWVRGYSLNSISIDECSGDIQNGECAEISRLLGSRIAIFNSEFRIPLFGTKEFGIINFPYLPTELTAFFDGGVAWRQHEAPTIKFDKNTTERVPVFSTGVSMRVNLLGYIVGEIFYVYPFQRPNEGWHFGFNLAPGW